MNRNAFDSLDREGLLGVALALAESNERLIAKVTNLEAEVARLQAKQDRPPKTPNNSSVPPSQGHKKTTEFVKSRRKKKPHPGAHRPLHPNPTHRRDVLASACGHCGADVSGAPQAPCEVYDRIEIPPIAPEITRVSLHGGVCPCCAGRFKAEAPAGLEPGSPFGPNLRAFVIYLRFTQNVGFERLSRLIGNVFGLDISEGALVNILSAAREPFAAASAAIRARLLSGSVICSDETGLRVGKRSWWLWVFHHGQDACFLTHPRRSKEAVEEFLGDVRPDAWVSDRYSAQAGWAEKDHQVCLAHLLRDTQYVIDAGDSIFAPALRHFIGVACDEAELRDTWNDATLKIHARRLEAAFDRVMALTPVHPAGVKWKSTVEKLRPNLFVFMSNREVPPTNNESERSLRPCATYRKVTNGFRSQWGAKQYADIRSVFETARRQSICPLQAIRDVIAIPIQTALSLAG
ncbi:MAG TPA: IS66 family transposase [Candidatus Acidoferrum sp.]|nr:IS66 family transposase [Candidatus Acidoferrum sp.]